MTARNPPRSQAPTYSGPQVAYEGIRPLDRPDYRKQSQSLYRVGDVAYRISDRAQEKLTEEAVSNAQTEGAKLGGLDTKKITVMRNGKPTEVDIPTLKRSPGTGAVAKAYNQAAEQAYAMRIDTATQQHIQAAAAENPADPEGLRQSLQGWHDGIKDLIPPEYSAKYEHDLYAMSQPFVTRAEKQLMQNIAHDQAVDAKLAQDTLVGSMTIYSGMGPEGAAIAAAQFKNYVDSTGARVGEFFSEADARAEIQDTLARAAHGALQATFEAPGDKRQIMQAFQSGKPIVSLPAVDENGEVHAALYDKNTLIQLVGPEKVQSIVNGLAVDIRMQESEARAAAAEARAVERERLASLQTDVQLSFPDAIAEAEATGRTSMTASDIYAAYPGEKNRKTAEKLVAKLSLAAQTGSVRKVIAGNSPEEDAAYIESLKPKAGDEDFADRQALYNLAVTERQGKLKALDSDPASYVMQTNETVQAAWEAAGDGKDPAKVQAAVAATKQAQTDLGVAPEKVQVMPAGHAQALASTINTAEPDIVAEKVDGISKAYGPEGLNQVIGAGVTASVKMVAFLDAPEYATARQTMIQAMQVKESVLVEQAKARGYTGGDVDDEIENLVGPLLDTHLPPSVARGYLDGIRQSALFEIANNGATPDEAVEKAWAPFADYYQFNGSYRVPKKWDGEQVSGALSGVIGTLETRDIMPAIVGQGSVDPAFSKSETINSIKRGNYRWVTDSNETGVILTYPEGNPVLVNDGTPEGTPLRVSFDELMVMPTSGGSMIDNLRGLSGAN